MTAFTYNTTAGEDTALAYILGNVNADRQAQVPPLAVIDTPTLVQSLLNRVFVDYARQAQKAAILAALTAPQRAALGF